MDFYMCFYTCELSAIKICYVMLCYVKLYCKEIAWAEGLIDRLSDCDNTTKAADRECDLQSRPWVLVYCSL